MLVRYLAVQHQALQLLRGPGEIADGLAELLQGIARLRHLDGPLRGVPLVVADAQYFVQRRVALHVGTDGIVVGDVAVGEFQEAHAPPLAVQLLVELVGQRRLREVVVGEKMHQAVGTREEVADGGEVADRREVDAHEADPPREGLPVRLRHRPAHVCVRHPYHGGVAPLVEVLGAHVHLLGGIVDGGRDLLPQVLLGDGHAEIGIRPSPRRRVLPVIVRIHGEDDSEGGVILLHAAKNVHARLPKPVAGILLVESGSGDDKQQGVPPHAHAGRDHVAHPGVGRRVVLVDNADRGVITVVGLRVGADHLEAPGDRGHFYLVAEYFQLPAPRVELPGELRQHLEVDRLGLLPAVSPHNHLRRRLPVEEQEIDCQGIDQEALAVFAADLDICAAVTSKPGRPPVETDDIGDDELLPRLRLEIPPGELRLVVLQGPDDGQAALHRARPELQLLALQACQETPAGAAHEIPGLRIGDRALRIFHVPGSACHRNLQPKR